MPLLHGATATSRGKGQKLNYMNTLCGSIYDVNYQENIMESYLITLRVKKAIRIRKVFL